MNTSRRSNSKWLLTLAGSLALLFSLQLQAQTGQTQAQAEQEQAQLAEEQELQATLQAEYEKALKSAEAERRSAEESMRTAREQLRQASDQQREATRERSEESTRLRAAKQAEMAKMADELERARRQLRETSREIARVDRELARARSAERASSYAYRTSSRPVIGVILGDADDVGVKVLGVSPDGPAERAGIKQGDVIIAVGGQVLAAVEESDNASDALLLVMKDAKANEPLTITYERNDKTVDTTLVPEVRKPISWRTVTRIPSAPRAPVVPSDPADPEKVITIERIVVPEVDTSEIAEHIEQLRIQVHEGNIMLSEDVVGPHDGEFEFEFHDMSEIGDFALHDANIWFGLPMARGLQLVELDSALGEYFKSDRGVLVIKAREDNTLKLVSGDVILKVGETEVNSPAEFMRALRGFDAGQPFELDIKRKRKNQTLEIVMPEKHADFSQSNGKSVHSYTITTQ